MKLTLTINSIEVVLEGTPNEMIEVIEHLNNKQEVEDDKFKDWTDWDAARGVMSPPELLQGDTVIYMTGDGAISVQKVGRLSWSKQVFLIAHISFISLFQIHSPYFPCMGLYPAPNTFNLRISRSRFSQARKKASSSPYFLTE